MIYFLVFYCLFLLQMYEDNRLHNTTEFSNLYAILTLRKRYRLILGNIR